MIYRERGLFFMNKTKLSAITTAFAFLLSTAAFLPQEAIVFAEGEEAVLADADEDGLFTDENGSLIVRCNPDRTGHTLFKADSIRSILDEKGWDIVWIVELEKIGGDERLYGYKMVVSSGLIYFDSKGSIAGRLIKKTLR